MPPVRIHFDPALPVMASRAFTAGGRKFATDDPFPWRDVGLNESQLESFWRSGLVYFALPVSSSATPQIRPPAKYQRRG